ncbi:Cof-type HAD-IIB family hydrolase [Evansella sp. AB-P1]|nr:Cof-type HAD-IIB family hydrolase [Evansella sp. AB-P1]MDG5789491.1 Cof-type HAD-IIB family hydrolase [Evansella sp. AB-P1]
MTNKKVVFLDIDGTILNENKEIPASAKEGIKSLHENGYYVSIATGRSPDHFRDIIKELEITSYVSFNGSYVVFNGEVIYENPLNTKDLLNLEEAALNREHPMVFLNENELFANHPDHHAIHESMGSLKLKHPTFHQSFHHVNPIYQALLFVENHETQWYEQNQRQFDYVRWHEKAIDVLPPNGSKANGIKEMLKKLNIPVENTIAFGDGLNDIEMLRYVGYGVAMGNGVKKAKEVANHVTDDVSKDGLYKAFVDLNLINELK